MPNRIGEAVMDRFWQRPNNWRGRCLVSLCRLHTDDFMFYNPRGGGGGGGGGELL